MSHTEREQGEQGFTLVELLVVIVLLSVVGTIAVGGIIRTSQGTRIAQARITAAAELETAMQRVVRDVRTADPVISASADAVAVVIYRDGGCTRKTYAVATTAGEAQLVERTQQLRLVPLSNSNGPCVETVGTETSSVLLRRLSSTAVFGYLTGGDTALAAPVAAPATIAATTVTLTRTLPESRPVLRLASRVSLKNYDTALLRSS